MAKDNKTELVRSYIRQTPGATIRETVKATGASRALVSLVRGQEAIRNGEMPRSGSRSDQSSDSAAATFDEVLQKVLQGTALKLTPPQQAMLFSELAAHPKAHPNTRITALNGLRALEASSVNTDSRGPRPPLTPDDKIHRLSLLLTACGPDLAARAWSKAFPTPESVQEPQPAPQP